MAANETAEAPGLIAVVGATGTGKSALSLALAERIARTGGRAEIVNADAMQLYRGMDIGTAKLAPAERRGIPHHLLDVLEVRDAASVAGYQPRARAAVEDIAARGATPILVGGSGLYVSSVLYDFAFPPRDPAVRSRLEAEAETVGGAVLADRLAALDPGAAARIDPANTRRVIRALEILELGGAGHGGALPQAPIPWRPSRVIGLGMERAALTARLDARVVGMWRDGLPEEAATLIPAGIEEGPTASRAIGYAQALAELRGEIGRDEAIAETQRLTRRYARRQVSWFRRDARVHWLKVRPGSRLPVEEAAAIAGLAPID